MKELQLLPSKHSKGIPWVTAGYLQSAIDALCRRQGGG